MTKAITDLSGAGSTTPDASELPLAADSADDVLSKKELQKLIAETTEAMTAAAEEMEFEQAAQFRDRVLLLKDMDLGLKPPSRSLLARGRAHRGAAGRSCGGKRAGRPGARAVVVRTPRDAALAPGEAREPAHRSPACT